MFAEVMRVDLADELDAFADANPRRKPGRGCWACQLPADVQEAIRIGKVERGLTSAQIEAWLTKKGYKGATRHKVFNHLEYHMSNVR